jgi:hypothetical protein
LFDGKDIDAWEAGGTKDVWLINADGEFYPAKRGPDLATRQRYTPDLSGTRRGRRH